MSTFPEQSRVGSTAIAERLRQAMAATAVTLRQLAGDLEVPYRTGQRYLAGGTMPAEFLARAAMHLNVSGEWLLTGEGQMSPIPRDEEERAFREIAAIVHKTERQRGNESEIDVGGARNEDDCGYPLILGYLEARLRMLRERGATDPVHEAYGQAERRFEELRRTGELDEEDWRAWMVTRTAAMQMGAYRPHGGRELFDPQASESEEAEQSAS